MKVGQIIKFNGVYNVIESIEDGVVDFVFSVSKTAQRCLLSDPNLVEVKSEIKNFKVAVAVTKSKFLVALSAPQQSKGNNLESFMGCECKNENFDIISLSEFLNPRKGSNYYGYQKIC